MVFLPLILPALVISPAVAQDGESFTDNIVIVLDASGSMTQTFEGGQSRWAGATQAIQHVVKQVPDTTQVGLVVFSAKGNQDDWVVPLGPNDPAKMKAALDSLRPHGGTPLGAYIKIGADRLLLERDSQHGYGTYRLLVVTDGRAGDPQQVDSHSVGLIQRGLGLDVIGVAMKEDHRLKTVADSYRRADDPTQLMKAVEEVLAEVSLDADSSVGADAFDATDGLPDAFAIALVRELTTFRNHPLGTTPKTAAPSGASSEPLSPNQTPPKPAEPSTSNECSVVSVGMFGFPLFGAFLAMSRRRRA